MERLTCLRTAGSSPQRTTDFKKKGSGIDKRTLRLHRRSIDQRKMRDATLVKQRGIDAMSPLKEVQNVVAQEAKNGATKKAQKPAKKEPDQNETLRNRLKKWKEEKELKKKLERERKAKRPAFKVRHIEYEKVPIVNGESKAAKSKEQPASRVTRSMTTQVKPPPARTARSTRSRSNNKVQEKPAAKSTRASRSTTRNTTQTKPTTTRVTRRSTRSTSTNKKATKQASPPLSSASESSQEESSSQDEPSQEPINPFLLPSVNVTRRGDAVDTFLQDATFAPVDFKFNFEMNLQSKDTEKDARRCSSTPMDTNEPMFKFTSPPVSAIKSTQLSQNRMSELVQEEMGILKPCHQETAPESVQMEIPQATSSQPKEEETEVPEPSQPKSDVSESVQMEIPQPTPSQLKEVETDIPEPIQPMSVETNIPKINEPEMEVSKSSKPESSEIEVSKSTELESSETEVSKSNEPESSEKEVSKSNEADSSKEVSKSSGPESSEIEVSKSSGPETSETEVPESNKAAVCPSHEPEVAVSKPSTAENQCDKQVVANTATVADEEKDVPYFRNLITIQTDRLNGMCSKWQDTMNGSQLSEEVLGEIRCTTGKAQLLIAQRFKQFSGLIDNCEFDSGEKKTHCSDLIGFWEMVYYQIEDVDKMFADLDKLQANNWQREVKVVKKTKKVLKKPKASAAPKKTAVDRTAARQRLMAAKAAMKSKATRSKDSEKVVFDAGFFKVESPVKKSPKVHAHCEAGSPLNSKFFRRTSSTPNKGGSRPGSRQGTPRQAFMPSNPMLGSTLCTPISKLALTDAAPSPVNKTPATTDAAPSPKTATKRPSPSDDTKRTDDLITMEDIPSPAYSKVVVRESVAHPLIPGIASPHLSNSSNGPSIFTPPRTITPSTHTTNTELICFDSPLAPSLAPPIPLQTPSSTATGSVLRYAAVGANSTTDLLMMSPVRRSSRLRSVSGPEGQMIVDALTDVSEPYGFRPNASLI